jgi:hypothetical protein
MAVLFSLGGFFVRSYAPHALDVMSLFVIESKGWLVFLLGQGLFLWLERYGRDRIAVDSNLRRMLIGSQMGQTCPVQVVVRQWGVVTGADQGLAWIDGDRLCFKGAATTFQTHRRDLPAWVMWTKDQRRNSDPRRARRRLPLPWADECSLEIEVINRHEDLGVQRRAVRFDQDLTRWFRDSVADSPGESVLPPSDVHPGVMPRPPFVWESATLTVAFLLMNMFAVFAPVPLDVKLPLFWYEVFFRVGSLAMSALLARELALTVHSQTIRAYHLHHGGPQSGKNRPE